MILKEYLETECPLCGDEMNERRDYAPTWSDFYQAIICWDCFAQIELAFMKEEK